jgi:hypothetical protein
MRPGESNQDGSSSARESPSRPTLVAQSTSVPTSAAYASHETEVKSYLYLTGCPENWTPRKAVGARGPSKSGPPGRCGKAGPITCAETPMRLPIARTPLRAVAALASLTATTRLPRRRVVLGSLGGNAERAAPSWRQDPELPAARGSVPCGLKRQAFGVSQSC